MRTVSPQDLGLAVRAVESGELVVIPTTRWYMICADAGNAQACESIFMGKRRPGAKSLAYVAQSLSACRDRFHLSTEAERLATAFWPGDLALLLPWRDPEEAAKHSAVGSPSLTTVAPGTLGKLAAVSTVPIAATTANISGDASPEDPGPAVTIAEVHRFLTASGLKPSVIVDGGVCPAANHMTIVDCFTPEARLIRTGLVHQRSVSAALGREVQSI
ncbi:MULTISPECIES: L-threonylcarbamoyladenylate synthase [Streptomyces]|uniref:L-threonylcarbamoyladenylate synthase n=1 Tax=Streptomyces tsukubensis (strain DSM 42081 / NBRC 108919 / NRRL 18488 / 9993) TaxID=1114943 RepID=I2N1F6_STRT9|nr:Sua5/YciO/YrdC/YwlC family protein [Streptomyces tsukubensis]MYS63150.1 translation factor Sua5 [Streptomyces sp. SID5473]AZK95027.1 translation factor Sua5 [Streptomyces tsukubensis]EIF90853.1 Sua5/YciO/YrdC/YwlC family protein [Streptomyces tsukubensis NRRL18488]QKM68907.1 translation factor Sua5 [Streptomyces tsukubensis NRRL18488]TAI43713.1 translation factor Sua5 [Streptomyces tsukubensis]